MVAANTCFGKYLGQISQKFDLLFKKRKYVHWYTNEGMSVDELVEAREEVTMLEKDYEVMEKGWEDWEGEDEYWHRY